MSAKPTKYMIASSGSHLTKPRTNTISGGTVICIPCLADRLHNHTTMMDTFDHPTYHPQSVTILEIIVEGLLLHETCLTLAHHPITAVTLRTPLHPTGSLLLPVAHTISKVHIDLALLQVSINMDPLMVAVHMVGLLGLILLDNRGRVKDDQGTKVEEEDLDLDLAEGTGNPVVRVHSYLDTRILIFRLDRQHRLELRSFVSLVEDREDLDRRIIRGGSRMGMGVGLVDSTMVDLGNNGFDRENWRYWKGPISHTRFLPRHCYTY